jgi:hypothetical protein
VLSCWLELDSTAFVRIDRDMNPEPRAARNLFSSRLLLGALLLNVSLALTYVGLWFNAARQDLFWRADFSAFYTGWAIIRDGGGTQLYDPDLQMTVQQQILEGRSFKDDLLPYVNPPHLTLPFVPLSRLPRTSAYLIWTLGQLGLLVWLLYLLYRLVGSWEPQERWLLLSAVVAFLPVMLTFLIGSFSLLLTLCLLQFYLALKRGDAGRAGLWLALGTVKPQAVLLLGVMLLAARRWRVILSGLLVSGALAVAANLVLGWHIWLDYAALLRSHTGLFDAFGVVPTDMHNLKGTLTLLLGNEQGSLINLTSYVALGGAAAMTFWLWWGGWRPGRPDFELRMALTTLLGVLFSVHSNPQDSLILVIPATLFYLYLRQRDLPRRACGAFLLLCPALFFFSEFTIEGGLGVRVPVLAMVVLAAWMVRALYVERPRLTTRPAPP